jgi:predicted phage terminase large subunit-like protein
LGSGLVKAAWFRHYAAEEVLPQFERIVQSWDTAGKTTELGDFSICTSWGIDGKNRYLLDVLRRRLEYPELKRAVREQYERLRPSVLLIEDNASGTQLIQELIREGLYAVTRDQPQSDKIMRMHARAAMIEYGFVYLPDAAPWLARADELPQRPARRPGRLDGTAAGLVQTRQRPQLQRGDLRTLPNAGRRRRRAENRARASGASARSCRHRPDEYALPERRSRRHGPDAGRRSQIVSAGGVGAGRRSPTATATPTARADARRGRRSDSPIPTKYASAGQLRDASCRSAAATSAALQSPG